MSQQIINVGAAPNDGNGDTPRPAGQKINANFTELYGFLTAPAANRIYFSKALAPFTPTTSANLTYDGNKLSLSSATPQIERRNTAAANIVNVIEDTYFLESDSGTVEAVRLSASLTNIGAGVEDSQLEYSVLNNGVFAKIGQLASLGLTLKAPVINNAVVYELTDNTDVRGWLIGVTDTNGSDPVVEELLPFGKHIRLGPTLAKSIKFTEDGEVGIGTQTPLGLLHIVSSATGLTPDVNSSAILESTSVNEFFTFLGPNNSSRGFLFGNAINSADGGVIYNSSTRALELRTGGNVARVIIDSDQVEIKPNLYAARGIRKARAPFNGITSTDTEGISSLYSCIDSVSNAILTISITDIIANGSSSAPWFFTVKDETGALVTNGTTVSIKQEDTTVSTAALAAGSGTDFVTLTVHNLLIGNTVVHTGFTDPTYNGTFVVTDIISTFEYEIAAITFNATGAGAVTNTIEGLASQDITADFGFLNFYADGNNILIIGN